MQLRLGDRVRGKPPYRHPAMVGTVVRVTPPAELCLYGEGGAEIVWDDGTCSWYSYQSMVVLLPEDYGAGE